MITVTKCLIKSLYSCKIYKCIRTYAINLSFMYPNSYPLASVALKFSCGSSVFASFDIPIATSDLGIE